VIKVDQVEQVEQTDQVLKTLNDNLEFIFQFYYIKILTNIIIQL